MRAFVSVWAAVLVLAALLLPAASPAHVAAQATDEGYTSPEFGYSVSWDETWSVSDETSDPGVDTLTITNGDSNLAFIAFASDQDAGSCLDEEYETYESNPSYSDVQIAQSADGGDLAGVNGDVVWSVIWFTFTANDGSTSDITAYIECRPIVEGESLLLVRLFTLFDSYNDQIDLVLEVINTIDVSGGTGAPRLGGEESEYTYVAPIYGYGFNYDEDAWTIAGEESGNGEDYIQLENEVSFISFVGLESTDSPMECVQGQIDSFEPNGFTNVRIADDTNGDQMAGGDDEVYFAVVWVSRENNDGSTTDYTTYLECRAIEPGESLVQITQFTLYDEYNDQIENRVAILDTFTMDAASASAEPPARGSSGSSYTSPTYGYSVSWDDSWSVSSENSSNGVDSLTLEGQIGLINLLGLEMPGSTSDCIDAQLEIYQSGDYEDGEIAVVDGEEIRDDARAESSAVMLYTYVGGREPAQFASYVECHRLGSGQMLVIVAIAVIDNAVDHFDAANEVIGTLELE